MCHQRLLNGLSAGRFENGDVTEDRLKSVCFNSYFFFDYSEAVENEI